MGDKASFAAFMTFAELGICPEILEAIDMLGFETPSPIQEQAIPPALAGADIVGRSHTGSGKTLAFTIPALEKIDATAAQVQVLCLAPTRELAVQISKEVDKLAIFLDNISAAAIYGGTSYAPQLAALRRGVPFVAGTPGRILDLIEKNELHTGGISMLILDEADEMLDMGFAEEIDRIVALLPTERQTLFFSATISPAIRSLIDRISRDPVEITIHRPELTVPTCEQSVYEVLFSSRIEVLSRLIEMGRMKRGLVFANTKRVVDDIVDGLLSRGYSVDRLHGDMPQTLRERVLASYRQGNLNVLVATDVAARGLDIEDVDIVVNFELPREPEDYVHRIGRTARAGHKGKAVTFIGRRDFSLLGRIERFTGVRMQREKVMTAEMVEQARREALVDDVLELATTGSLDLPEELQDIELPAEQIASAMFELLIRRLSRELHPIPEDMPNRSGMAHETRPKRPFDEKGDSMTLFINAGKMLRIRPKDVAGLLYNEGGAPKGSVGDIRIFLKHTLVDVSPDVGPLLIERLSVCSLCGYEVNVREDKGHPDGHSLTFSPYPRSSRERRNNGDKNNGRRNRRSREFDELRRGRYSRNNGGANGKGDFFSRRRKRAK